MRKALLLGLLLIFTGVAVFAGPTIGFRTFPGASIVPSLGVQYAGKLSPFIEVYKPDIWSLSLSGTYNIEGGVAFPFSWGQTAMKVPIGVVVPLDVDTGPLTVSVSQMFGVVGLWVDGGYGAAIRLEALYDAHDWTFTLGVQVDLHGLWLMIKPEVKDGEAQ